MKSILNFFLTFLLFALTAAASAAPIQLHWNLCKGATLETRDGRQYLRVVVRPEDKDAMNCAEAEFDHAPYVNSLAEFTIRARAREVSKPANTDQGVKFALHFIDATGSGMEFWNGVKSLDGTFDWREISFPVINGVPGKKSQLLLGLQGSSGEVEFDLDSLQVAKMFTAPEAYKAVYSDTVASTPPLRGVISPLRFKEEDFDTLAEWNVNIVRAQMTFKWYKDAEFDRAEFDSWLDDLLAHYEKMFPIGYRKGIRFIMDLHTPPGGRYRNNNELAMYYEEKCADHFVEVWKKIATRFKDNPAVWGYDLINEPLQYRRAPYDYWNLQRRAAEAIREIDPERPIIFEANYWDSGQSFRYLAPLKLKNIIYSVHMYSPGSFTHQRVRPDSKLRPGEKPVVYPGMIGVYFNKETLRRVLEPVREFQKKYGARIYAGEFAAVTWAPGAADYLRDCIEIFEEYGWDWSYHAFRETPRWDVEKAGTSDEDIRPAPDTDRKRVLLEGFRKNRMN